MDRNPEKDPANKAFMLELSYRMTVAANMAAHKLESLSWMEAWHADTIACAQKWYDHLVSLNADKEDGGALVIQEVRQLVLGLSPGHSKFVGIPFAPFHDYHAYTYLFEHIERLADASAFAEWKLFALFVLGRQLAQNDLRTHFATLGKTDLPVHVSKYPPFLALSENSFPCPWPVWPDDLVFNNNLIRYISNRQRSAGSETFAIGPLVCLIQSILCPNHFPSTAWCWQDWEKRKPWHLFLAGALFPQYNFMAVTDENDKAVITLFDAMNRDKKADRPIGECGWVPRNELWPETTSSNTRSKAWNKLTRKTLAVLGVFESMGGAGKHKDTGAPCRLPAAFADPACRIFIEKLK